MSAGRGGGRSVDRAWLLAAAIGLLGFVVLTGLMLARVGLWFDQPLLQAAEGIRGDGSLWRAISESANIPLIVIGVAMVLVLLVRRRFRHAILVAVVLLAVTAGSEGVKQLVARPRPEGTDPNIPGVVYSYPSGHVLEALVIFGVIAIEIARRGIPTAVAVLVFAIVAVDATLVGVARVALAAHYPSDALGGGLAGVGVLGLYGWMTRRIGLAPGAGNRAGQRSGPGRGRVGAPVSEREAQ
jgi:membrane-associated phospholipid phosphatase